MLIATGACRHADFAVVFYTALYGLWGTFAHVVIYGGQGRWPYFFMDINHLGLWCIMWYCVLLLIQVGFWWLFVKLGAAKSAYFAKQGHEILLPEV
jgi:hypothetical protein